MQSLLNKKKGQIFKGNFHIKINLEFVTRSFFKDVFSLHFAIPCLTSSCFFRIQSRSVNIKRKHYLKHLLDNDDQLKTKVSGLIQITCYIYFFSLLYFNSDEARVGKIKLFLIIIHLFFPPHDYLVVLSIFICIVLSDSLTFIFPITTYRFPRLVCECH